MGICFSGCESDLVIHVEFVDSKDVKATTTTSEAITSLPTIQAYFSDSDRNDQTAFRQAPLLTPELFEPGSEGYLAAKAGLEAEAAACLGWRLRREAQEPNPHGGKTLWEGHSWYNYMDVEAPWLLDGKPLTAVAAHQGLAFFARLARLTLSHPCGGQPLRQRALRGLEELRRHIVRLLEAALRVESVCLSHTVSSTFVRTVLERLLFVGSSSSSRGRDTRLLDDNARGSLADSVGAVNKLTTRWAYPVPRYDGNGSFFDRPGRSTAMAFRSLFFTPSETEPWDWLWMLSNESLSTAASADAFVPHRLTHCYLVDERATEDALRNWVSWPTFNSRQTVCYPSTATFWPVTFLAALEPMRYYYPPRKCTKLVLS